MWGAQLQIERMLAVKRCEPFELGDDKKRKGRGVPLSADFVLKTVNHGVIIPLSGCSWSFWEQGGDKPDLSTTKDKRNQQIVFFNNRTQKQQASASCPMSYSTPDSCVRATPL